MEDQILSTTLMQIMFLIWMALVVLTSVCPEFHKCLI